MNMNMNESYNNINISLTEKHNEIANGIAYLTNELTSKKGDLENLRNTIKQLKLNYNKEIKDYQSLTENILSNECLIETFQYKIAKVNHKQMLILNNINAQFYNHFNDIANNNSSDINNQALDLIFEFCSFAMPIRSIDLISILHNEVELIELLSYSALSQVIAHGFRRQDFDSFKCKVNEYIKENKSEMHYPFDSLFEYVQLTYEGIDLDEEKNRLERGFEVIVEQKNVKFLSLKALEGIIIRNDTLYKTTVKYIKGINTLLEKNKDQPRHERENEGKPQCEREYDVQEMNTFLNALKHFKSFDFSICKYDNMNSLSIQSEYSENNSVDTCSFVFKTKPNENSNSNTNANHDNYKPMISHKLHSNQIPNSNNNDGSNVFSPYNNNNVTNKYNSNKALTSMQHNLNNENKEAKMRNRENINGNSLAKIKKINSLTHFKKLNIVKPKEKRGSKNNQVMETTPNLLQKETITSLITDENNNDNDNGIIRQNQNQYKGNMIKTNNDLGNAYNNNNHINNVSQNNKDSVCDEKINSSLNPKRVETAFYINNSNKVTRKQMNTFYLKFEHSESYSNMPGCCQSCT